MSPSKKSPCSSRLEDEKQDDAGGKVGCGGGVVVEGGGGGGGGGGGDPPPGVLGHSVDPVVESIQLLTAGTPILVNVMINFLIIMKLTKGICINSWAVYTCTATPPGSDTSYLPIVPTLCYCRPSRVTL